MKWKTHLPTWRQWGVYLGVVMLTIFLHELGHCIPAWAHGLRAYPTPAKQYSLDSIPETLMPFVSLGGLAFTFFCALGPVVLFGLRSRRIISPILAGSLAMPGIYTFRFLLAGRGHDATEFQEAQSALGMLYDGHSADWLFFSLTFAGLLMWVSRTKPRWTIIWTWLLGTLITVVFISSLQKINNAVFDPMDSSAAVDDHGRLYLYKTPGLMVLPSLSV